MERFSEIKMLDVQLKVGKLLNSH